MTLVLDGRERELGAMAERQKESGFPWSESVMEKF